MPPPHWDPLFPPPPPQQPPPPHQCLCAAECFLSTRSMCFRFVESCLKHSYFFANPFSLSASRAAKNALHSLVPRPVRAIRVTRRGLEPSPRRIFPTSLTGDVICEIVEDDWERGCALRPFWIQTGCRKRLNIFAWSRDVSGMEMCNVIFR